ncbi:MAG: universal stress protein [Actinomycetota bacterium]
MRKIIAALDNGPAARPVLGTAIGLGPVLDATVEALHVTEDGDTIARTAAQRYGINLRTAPGPVAKALVSAGQAEEVVAEVVGARGTRAGRRPAGHTALEVITSLNKAVVVVPPEVALPFAPRRLLFPLECSLEAGAALEDTLQRACECGCEVIVAHVHDEASLPLFEDHGLYETDAWTREFLARYCASAQELARVEVRVGVPAPEILGLAATTDADLITLGWSQDLSPGHAAVVREVLERSSVPILLLPANRAPLVPAPEGAVV